MDAVQRHKAILRAVRKSGSVRVNDLAEQLGVTPVTVRRDINDLAREGALTRVHGGATLPEPPEARRPASSRAPAPQLSRPRPASGTIGMVVPATSYYYREVIEGARAAAEALGLRLVLGVSRYDPAEDRLQIDQLLEGGISGLLFTPSTPTGLLGQEWSWVAELPVPVILVERRQEAAVDADPLECVTTDHELGAAQAVRHLAGLGHRRIALITRPTPTSRWVRRGFDSAVTAFGLAPDALRVFDPPGAEATQEERNALVDAIVADGATAVLAHPDEEAVTLLQQLRAKGLSLPDDIALVSYDDEFAALADLPLTAVAPPRRQLGLTAVELLAHRLQTGSEPVLRHVSLLPTLHVRASTTL
ncbi:substrate-binding domain-containing protein [Streptomyces lavendulocolor]|uniref:substrate-binding domain-containing protein n=1 Tax=Streptomyces lavendulocolor TaxID=67316 RepID=UPI003C2D5FCB